MIIMALDVEEYKNRAIKILHACVLIAEAKLKKTHLKSSSYYKIFGTVEEQQKDLEKIDQVINRLINYLNQMK